VRFKGVRKDEEQIAPQAAIERYDYELLASEWPIVKKKLEQKLGK